MPVGHDPIANDLAAYLNSPITRRPHCVTWQNIEFPGVRRRPDVYALTATLNPHRWSPTVYEVKAARSDFRKEVNTGKWKVYQPFAAYVVFACVEGLIKPDELPDGCGLIVRTATTWDRVVRGRRNPDWVLTPRQWMNLCLKSRNPTPYEILYRKVR